MVIWPGSVSGARRREACWHPPAPTGGSAPGTGPSVQVIEYGEAVALVNVNGDLPVELPFRKVTFPPLHRLTAPGLGSVLKQDSEKR